MIKFLAILFATLLSASAAYAADTRVVDCGVVKCNQYNLNPRPPIATNIPLAQICYQQAVEDKVVLVVYYKNGTTHTYPPQKAVNGCFKIGLHDQLDPQLVDRIELCNGTNTSVLRNNVIAQLYVQKGMTSTQFACLKGKDCANYKGQYSP